VRRLENPGDPRIAAEVNKRVKYVHQQRPAKSGSTAIILALWLPAGIHLGMLYLKRGNLTWAVLIGVLVSLNFTTAALMATAGQPRNRDVLGPLLLWSAVCSAANAFVDELWFESHRLESRLDFLHLQPAYDG
jgi:hypothetical protein